MPNDWIKKKIRDQSVTFTLSPMRAFLSMMALFMWEFLPMPIGTLPFAAKNLLSASVCNTNENCNRCWVNYTFALGNIVWNSTKLYCNKASIFWSGLYLVVICSHQQWVFNDCTFRYAGAQTNNWVMNFAVLQKRTDSSDDHKSDQPVEPTSDFNREVESKN